MTTITLLRQTWTISAVLINMFGMGMILSYPTSLLPALNDPDSTIKTDLHSSSWLGSIPSIAGVPGFLVSSVVMAVYGRRITHGLIILPAIVGWLLIYFANDITMLMIGRFLCGLTAVPIVTMAAIMVGEYSCPKYRGVFLNLKNVSVCLGIMFMHIISMYLHWRTIALVSLIPLLAALLITCTWVESPAWLVSKQKYEKSQETFFRLRGNSVFSQREIDDIIEIQKAHLSKTVIRSSCCGKVSAFFHKFTQRDFLKPTFIMMLATIVLEMSGRHVYPVYALHILSDITGETFHSFYYTLGIDILITSSALFASFFVKIMNRRTLLFSSGIAAIVTLIIFCSYLMLVAKGIISVNKPWIPITLLVCYFVFANLGCAPIPLALIGEIFPLAHREVGSAISGAWISVSLLVALKTAPHLLISIKVYGFFAVYCLILAICLLILYFILPETKDKTLQDIENYFKYSKSTVVLSDNNVNNNPAKV